jgi:tetratricopeptide (TPR) repeat protein
MVPTSSQTKRPSRCDQPTTVRCHLLCLSCLTIAAALAFGLAIPGEFVWVDRVEIVEAGYRVTSPEDFARLWTLTLDEYLFRDDQPSAPVAPSATDPSHGGYWRPLYALGLTLDWWLFGDVTWRWHAVNILWHVGVVWLLYALGNTFFSAGASFFAALLFAVHPLDVHSVAWISGRKDLQCAFFGLIAVLAYLQIFRGRRPTAWMAVSCLAISCLATAVSIGFKELGLCVPIFLTSLTLFAHLFGTPLAELGPSADRRKSKFGWFAVLLAALAQLVVLLAVVGYRRAVFGSFGLGASYPAGDQTSNVATGALLAWHYVGRVFWPWLPQISDRFPVSDGVDVKAALAIVGLVVVAAGAWWLFRRRADPSAGLTPPTPRAKPARWLWVPLLWYVVWMLPASGLLPLRHVRAERYLYPASWGLLLLFCAAVAAGLRDRSRAAKRAAGLFATAMAIAWMTHTAKECYVWRDDKTLFRTAVLRDADYLEGRVALSEIALSDGDYVQSVRHAEIADRLAADHRSAGYWSPFIAKTNHGLALYHLARHEEALRQFTAALNRRPHSAAALYHLGLVATATGQLDQAVAWFEASLRAKPDDFLAQSNLAYVWLQLGNVAASRDLLLHLVELHPENALNVRNLAACHMASQDYVAAIGMFGRLVAHEKAIAIDYAKLAWCELKVGESILAQRHLETALRLAPHDAVVKQIAEMVEREIKRGDSKS